MRGPLIFSGNANRPLAEAVARELGITVSRALVETFPDGETRGDFIDSVRDGDVYIIQPTCPPVNNHLMELLIMADAAWRASASRVTVVMPYMGYSRQEKRSKGREPISARLVADLLAVAKVNRVVTVDLTTRAIEGFFSMPIDNLLAGRVLADYCLTLGLAGASVISPDAGWVDPSNDFRRLIRSSRDLSLVFKNHPEVGKTEALGMVGDVAGSKAIVVDDIISTGKTTIQAGELALSRGATEVYACATHPVFAPGAIELLNASPLKNVVVTDSIPIVGDLGPKIVVVSIAPLLAQAIVRLHEGDVLSDIYRWLRGLSEEAPWQV